MFSIIGGRIRCEMGKSGYECYRHCHTAHNWCSAHLRSVLQLFSPSIVGGSAHCEACWKADGGDRESGTDNWR